MCTNLRIYDLMNAHFHTNEAVSAVMEFDVVPYSDIKPNDLGCLVFTANHVENGPRYLRVHYDVLDASPYADMDEEDKFYAGIS